VTDQRIAGVHHSSLHTPILVESDSGGIGGLPDSDLGEPRS
jgi:hypothetical protein